MNNLFRGLKLQTRFGRGKMMVVNDNDNIKEAIKQIESFVVYQDGKQTFIDKSNKDFSKFIERIEDCFSFSRIMPAFGVSLHDLTVEDMKKGDWLKINFSNTQTINELPFEALLFRLDECYGINLIRQTEGKFQGRCIYLDLNEKTDLKKIVE